MSTELGAKAESNLHPDSLANFREQLHNATGERAIQDYLKNNRELLAMFAKGGHGKWVVPKPKFGSTYEPDFVIGSRNSLGYSWHLIELEPVDLKMWNQDATPSERLRGGIRQIMDWRNWLENNLHLAQKIGGDGLAFPQISPQAHGIVFMSRSSEENSHPLSEEIKRYRRQIERENNISIRSYDAFLVELESIREFLQKKVDDHSNYPLWSPLDPELPQPNTESLIYFLRADFPEEYDKWKALIENPPREWKDIEPAVKLVISGS